MNRWRSGSWLALYLLLLLGPLALAAFVDPLRIGRPALVEFGVATGLLAFPAMLLQFALVSRLGRLSRAWGVDVLMQFHRQMGLASALFTGLHVAALTAAASTAPAAAHPAAAALGSGGVALLALAVLVVTSVGRRRLHLDYRAWQAVHAAAPLVIVAASVAHLFIVDGYLRSPLLQAAVAVYATLFVALLVRHRLWRPWQLARRPWEVIANRGIGPATRALELRPVGHAGFDFEAGQFAWLATGASPFARDAHPVTLSSSAVRAPGDPLEMQVKALGDWSRIDVPALAPGRRVWLDGPYGAFSPDGRDASAGLVLVSGGIGLTPMLSILRTLRDRGDRRPVTWIHAARSAAQDDLAPQLDSLEAAPPTVLVRVYETPPAGWTGETGRVDRALLQRHLPAGHADFEYFVCGPGPMLDGVEQALLELGVPSRRIRIERYEMV